MIKLVDLLKEVQLSSQEQDVLDDILSLDEAVDFSSVANMISGIENVKIYRAVGQTQGAAMQSAMQQAKNPIKSFKFSRTVGSSIEVLIAVSSK
jgi:hypothetical protein